MMQPWICKRKIDLIQNNTSRIIVDTGQDTSMEAAEVAPGTSLLNIRGKQLTLNYWLKLAQDPSHPADDN